MMKPLIIAAGLCLMMGTGVQAAENVYLSLQNNGTDIKGESSTKNLGRADSIECVSYEQEVETVNRARCYQPLVIVKRIDKSSPLLMKAMIKNEN